MNGDTESKTNMVKGLIGVAAGPAGAAVSYLEHLSAGLRLLGLVLGCAVSAAMFWSIVANQREKRRLIEEELATERVKRLREMARLCHYCRQGDVPAECPLPPMERPDGCPRGKSEVRVPKSEKA